MSNAPDPLIARVLGKPLDPRDRPTQTHYTLEVVAYWSDDLLDSVRAGRKRKLVVGGYHANRRADLQVELPQTMRRFTLARIRDKEADVIVPRTAVVGLQRQDGTIEYVVSLKPCRAPFEAGCCRIAFGERICFKVEKLSFLVQFVHRDGKPRTAYDWLLPRQLAGEP